MKGLFSLPLADRLALHIVPVTETGCWLWIGSAYSNGYGQMGFKGRSHLAHRLSYQAHIGPIPDGLTIDHLCRVRCCINPAHLEAVTQSVNVSRGIVSTDHAWGPPRKTHCPKGHAYDPTHRSKLGQSICRACGLAQAKGYYARNSEAVKARLKEKWPARSERINAARRVKVDRRFKANKEGL